MERGSSRWWIIPCPPRKHRLSRYVNNNDRGPLLKHQKATKILLMIPTTLTYPLSLSSTLSSSLLFYCYFIVFVLVVVVPPSSFTHSPLIVVVIVAPPPSPSPRYGLVYGPENWTFSVIWVSQTPPCYSRFSKNMWAFLPHCVLNDRYVSGGGCDWCGWCGWWACYVMFKYFTCLLFTFLHPTPLSFSLLSHPLLSHPLLSHPSLLRSYTLSISLSFVHIPSQSQSISLGSTMCGRHATCCCSSPQLLHVQHQQRRFHHCYHRW